MYCMQADGHIYTLNYNIKRLEQHQEGMDEDELELYASADYTINEESKPKEAKMIDHIDDIVKIAKEVAEYRKEAKLAKKEGDDEQIDERKVITLIHRTDDLLELLHQMLQAGYNPGINFEAGRITALKLEFDRVFYVIQAQQLDKTAIDGIVAVADEATYNNMNKAMNEFNHKIFINSHKSHYSALDVEVLDEYRSKPIVGNLRKNEPREFS